VSVGVVGEGGGVPGLQRARILGALVEVARECGAGRVTVSRVVARSGVSRRTFYEFFEDRDACFAAAFQDAVVRAAVRVAPEFVGSGGWRERVRGALGALLGLFDEEPGLGGLCVVDALGAGPLVLAQRAEVVRVLVDAVDEGRTRARASGLSRLTAEGVVGGVLAVLYARLAEDGGRARRADGGGLVGLLSPLMAMIVLPYLGAGAAAREAARPAPRMHPRPVRSPSNPLDGLRMRLTYRTVRVLAAVGRAPGASNRQVADAAGIHDQGQASKLLARLEQLGLISNATGSSARGEANAWQLTKRGKEIENAIHQQTAPLTS
jgi:AcrR family transcriptional regulator/DNA-binding MarR family transcriptional regulator